MQVLADDHGNVVHLGERDCTIQRRHQKLVEETPSPAVDDALRARIGAIAVEAARAVGYRSAGTIEGLLAPDGAYYFLEMNTRVQVEHTVTEAVTGIDIVREQVGSPPASRCRSRRRTSSCAATRSSAASTPRTSTRGFLPAPGLVTAYREPGGIGVRVDSGCARATAISDLYDPLVAKLVVHDVDREHARRRMLRALEEFVIEGPTTLLGFHRALLVPVLRRGRHVRGVTESEELARASARARRASCLMGQRAYAAARTEARPTRERRRVVELDGRRHEVRVHAPEPPWAELARRHRSGSKGLAGEETGAVVSPMQGTVLGVEVADGEAVEAGGLICVIEAMKMENEIVAHRDGVVSQLGVAGQQVAHGQLICVVRDPEHAGPRGSTCAAGTRGP